MEFAIQTPPEHTPFSSLLEVWQAADELGYRAAFTFDHFVPLNPGERPGVAGGGSRRGPQLEGWVTLACLAAQTRHLQVGTLVTGVTYRHPALLAKMAVTLDHATGGRCILGIGAAWHEEEHRMYGIPFPPPGERMGRLEETLQIFELLCAEAVSNFEGRYYQLRDAVFEPKPVHPGGIPVLVGGSGSRLKRIAGRHASIFNSFSAPWEWKDVNVELDARAREAGRDPADISRSAFVFSELSGNRDRERELIGHFQRTRGGSEDEVRARVLVGTAGDMQSVVRSYADAGIGLMVVNLRPPFDSRGIARFSSEVMQAFMT